MAAKLDIDLAETLEVGDSEAGDHGRLGMGRIETRRRGGWIGDWMDGSQRGGTTLDWELWDAAEMVAKVSEITRKGWSDRSQGG